MKAIVQDTYGSSDVLESRDIDKPEVGDTDVLVRVHAASVHVGDWIVMTGVPFVMRMATGLRKPKHPVPGTDIAGTVEAVGKDVRSSDRATRSSAGARARSPSTRSASEDQFVLKPANLTFEQAAAVGVSASTALQLLRDDGQGAAGPEGPHQRRVRRRRHVRRPDRQGVRRRGHRRDEHRATWRWSARSAPTTSSTTPTTTSQGRAATTTSSSTTSATTPSPTTRRALTPDGTLLPNGGGHSGGGLGRVIKAHVAATFVRQQGRPSIKFQNADDLAVLKDLVEAGKVMPVIDGTYPLSETPEAIEHVAAGHARGTIVIAVSA